eukprot:4279757-Prymnesium_polylepis.1
MATAGDLATAGNCSRDCSRLLATAGDANRGYSVEGRDSPPSHKYLPTYVWESVGCWSYPIRNVTQLVQDADIIKKYGRRWETEQTGAGGIKDGKGQEQTEDGRRDGRRNRKMEDGDKQQ